MGVKRSVQFGIVGLLLVTAACAQQIRPIPAQTLPEVQNVTYNELTPAEERVIIHKGTEMPFTNEFHDHHEEGTYTCTQCDAPLYISTDKFVSDCGWPSFDDEIDGAVLQVTDADGMRTEIICANCGGHLGHVFLGEGLTSADTRHCVNSISMKFVLAGQELPSAITTESQVAKEATTETAYLAGGCFWGTEHLVEALDGVLSVRSGYMGGRKDDPTYEEISTGRTGHAETVEVVFDPSKTDFETITRYFFEIHDPTQQDRQGPDVGSQYRSAVFYVDTEQRDTTEELIQILKGNGYDVVTEVEPADTFWPAEDYHQDYYANTGKRPYCHFYVKRF